MSRNKKHLNFYISEQTAKLNSAVLIETKIQTFNF